MTRPRLATQGLVVLCAGLLANGALALLAASSAPDVRRLEVGSAMFWGGLFGPFTLVAKLGRPQLGLIFFFGFIALAFFLFWRCRRPIYSVGWGLAGLFVWLFSGWIAIASRF